MSRRRAWTAGVVLALSTVLALAVGTLPGLAGASASASASRHAASSATASTKASAGSGGSVTMLLTKALSWQTLDPLKGNTEEWDLFNAIYGGLFEPGAKGKPEPDLATGYSVSKTGKTVTIDLRQGVTFSDGTPFDASAVAYNFKRDFTPSNGCICAETFPVASITTPNTYTVVLHLKEVFSPIIDAFLDNTPDWIVSPTALQKDGESTFGADPVGAGPFVVVTNKPGTSLVLKRNPHYWQAGHPHLSKLTFELAPSTESAYEDLQANAAQVYGCMSSPKLAKQAAKQYRTETVWTSCNGLVAVQLNTKKPPFNNIEAREAMYYATNPKAIDKSLYGGTAKVMESVAGPADLFSESKVPGYRTYDLAKAKALVKQLGGLSITMNVAAIDGPIATELQSEWEAAGIKVTTKLTPTIEASIQLYMSGNWSGFVTPMGSYDPGAGTGLSFRYGAMSPFSGVDNPTLTHLLAEGSSTWNTSARASIYAEIFDVISKDAYTPVLFTVAGYNVADKDLTGPGISSSSPEIQWQDVSVKKK